ncbi:hypothetical protein Q7P35_009858 [Cladosporium inversicolor]
MHAAALRRINNSEDFKLLLELYEYSHTQFPSQVDHQCANACLDGIRAMLDFDFDEYCEVDIFGNKDIPTLVDVVTRLDKFNEKGVQMLVDILVHSNPRRRRASIAADMIKNTGPVPGLAGFFQKLSYAFAIKYSNATPDEEDDPDEVVSAPDPMSPHAYHSRSEGESLCCHRLPPMPIATERGLTHSPCRSSVTFVIHKSKRLPVSHHRSKMARITQQHCSIPKVLQAMVFSSQALPAGLETQRE